MSILTIAICVSEIVFESALLVLDVDEFRCKFSYSRVRYDDTQVIVSFCNV